MQKKRLDIALSEQMTRNKAQGLILSGKILVNEIVITKAGYLVSPADIITIKETDHFVSRGGDKLLGSIKHFTIDFTNKVCLDIGASTGGFTDCMLQHDAKKVYALDVGYGQLDWKLRNDPRVVCIERVNIRYWDWHEVIEPIDIVTIDASFISLEKILPLLPAHIHHPCLVIALIKPQFEVGQDKIAKGGVVREEAYREEAIEKITCIAKTLGFVVGGVCPSVLKGPAGNQEYFILLRQG